MLLLKYFLASFAFQIGNAILCHQCEGWRGHKDGGHENSCWKYNNNCETNVFCVKITEPMTRDATYEPYRSECWWASKQSSGGSRKLDDCSEWLLHVFRSSHAPKTMDILLL
ncbi:hypothetical protein L5515_013300 [Caenorhabditis briggsae]|uniref:Secreted protein n=1 Tax=Caenorhabditis briggsae TaxID=6238 RepID=A0AAE9E607_CAEBR|nr:hypothetical protein L5515_013300 [Caenorhabditis briggsae]